MYIKQQMYTFYLLGHFCPKIVKKLFCVEISCDVLKVIKAHLCNAKFPGKHHLQSVLTSQSGVTLFFLSRQSCECGRRLARAQLWAVLPVVGGEFEVLGKRAVHSQ